MIVQIEQLKLRINNLDAITNEYIIWKKDHEVFKEHLDKKIEEANKNRVRDSILSK